MTTKKPAEAGLYYADFSHRASLKRNAREDGALLIYTSFSTHRRKEITIWSQ
jgi:hypothetical protein